MAKAASSEQWKSIQFDESIELNGKVEVSNLGRVRTYNRIYDGKILNLSDVKGYTILRLKLYKARPLAVNKQMKKLQKEIALLKLSLKENTNKKSNTSIVKNIEQSQAALKALQDKDFKNRVVNYHCLVHRLVATYFLRKPAAGKTIVAHLDYNKQNNSANNLQWMTIAENKVHQSKSPLVIAEKLSRKNNPRINYSKLTEKQVVQIKKGLASGKSQQALATKFKVSAKQISRIKTGENWSTITID